MSKMSESMQGLYLPAVKDLQLSYYREKAHLSTIYPYRGNLVQVPQQQPSIRGGVSLNSLNWGWPALRFRVLKQSVDEGTFLWDSGS